MPLLTAPGHTLSRKVLVLKLACILESWGGFHKRWCLGSTPELDLFVIGFSLGIRVLKAPPWWFWYAAKYENPCYRPIRMLFPTNPSKSRVWETCLSLYDLAMVDTHVWSYSIQGECLGQGRILGMRSVRVCSLWSAYGKMLVLLTHCSKEGEVIYFSL